MRRGLDRERIYISKNKPNNTPTMKNLNSSKDDLPNMVKHWNEDLAIKYRDRLIELYGKEDGSKIKYAEAFELCQYGRQPSMEELQKLFLLKVREEADREYFLSYIRSHFF